jgi:integrase
MDPAEAKEAVKREMARLKAREAGGPKVSLLEANERLLRKYWDQIYEHRNNRDPDAAWYRLRRAVLALGTVPLTASRDEIQQAVNLQANNQRDVVAALNQILKWMGRADTVLTRFRPEERVVLYKSLAELEELSGSFEEPFRTLCWVAFATGCRLGEIFHLQPKHYNAKDCWVYVEAQRREDWEISPPKNRKHRAAVIPEAIPWLLKWFSVPESDKKELRRKRHAELFRRVAGKDFKFHDLRHSYAIHLLTKGASLELVAQSLGDDIQVVQMYYAGFVLHDFGLETLNRLLAVK